MIICIFAITLVAEIINSSMGMMYGTLLSPILVLLGYDPSVAIPAVLASQGLSAMVAAFRHDRNGHADFSFRRSIGTGADLKSFYMIALPGMIAVVVGALVAVKVPPFWLKLYISILILAASVMVVADRKFVFSYGKMFLVGLISSFNKVVSGGGFGPFVTSSQISVGQDGKKSVSVTMASEVPICLGGFAMYCLLKGKPDWMLVTVMCVSACIGALIGPEITRISHPKRFQRIVGALALVSGILLFLNAFGWIRGVSV